MMQYLYRDNKLTVIIPFLNEGEEVELTLSSIRETAGETVNILIINDASTDQIDYQSIAHKYKSNYLRNKMRLGVAASRDKGITLINTPYFLLLDAHMRFYQNNWVERIIEELNKNDRVVLCCNTKALSKDNTGKISESDDAHAFGARINFECSKLMLNPEWCFMEKEPENLTEDIACILGAGYAASKRYWQHLGGLKGLIYYGGDETYISIKVWLEGGQCRLIKDIIIGHIYRKQAPYRIESKEIIYNKLWIAETLFPFTYKLRTFGALYLDNPQNFKEAYQQLFRKRKKIQKFKEYHEHIFTVDFNTIISLNKKTAATNDEPEKKKDERLNQLFNKVLLNCSSLTSEGLWYGRMGCILFIAGYDHFQNKDLYEALIEDILDELYKNLEGHSHSIDFSEGLCGIAYGFAWLLDHQLFEGDIAKILEEIDCKIMEREPLRITDYSLKSGLAGILYYILYRLQIAQKQNAPLPFDTKYLDHLYKAALKTIKIPEGIACFEMASWLIAYIQDKSLKLEIPEISQLLNLSTIKEKTAIRLGLKDGLAGLGLRKLTE